MAEASPTLDDLKNQFAEFLKMNKYRNTQERYKVLDRIAALDRHFSADELYMYMHAQGDHVSRATIYSTLDLLTKCSILMKHRFQGDSAHYELSSRMPEHDHLICVDCGHIVEFRDEDIDSIRNRVAEKNGFKSVAHSLQVFAKCNNPVGCEHNHRH